MLVAWVLSFSVLAGFLVGASAAVAGIKSNIVQGKWGKILALGYATLFFFSDEKGYLLQDPP